MNKLVDYESHSYTPTKFIIKYEWNKLVDCGYLSFMVKVKYESYCVTGKNDKIGPLLWDRESIY